MHVINTGNIVITGVRKQETQTLDFLTWPDDAKAYLWAVITRKERPYLEGSVTGGMFFTKFSIGDCLRIKVRDAGLGLVFDRVFEVLESSIAGYPSEEVTLEIQESAAWYGLLDDCTEAPEDPNSNPEGGWDAGQEPKPELKLIGQLPMIAMIGSPHLIGTAAFYFMVSGVLETLVVASVWAVANCLPDTPASEEEPLATVGPEFPLLAILTEPYTIKAGYPGFWDGNEIHAQVWKPAADVDISWSLPEILSANCLNFAGTQSMMFNTDDANAANCIMFSKASMSSPSGIAVCMRAISILPYELDDDTYLKIQGLYLVDGVMELNLPAGSVIGILPPSSTYSAYCWSPYPLITPYGQTALSTAIQSTLRTTVENRKEALPWAESYCAQYQPHDDWMETPVPIIYGVNSSTPPFLPSQDAVYVGSFGDTITFYVSAADLTKVSINDEMFGLPQAHQADFHHGMPLNIAESSRQAETRQSGISEINVQLTIKYEGGNQITTRVLTNNKCNFTTSLSSLGISVASGTILLTEFTIYYSLTTIVLDARTNTKPLTVRGPRIYIA
jgi:hypothetical protein